MKQIVSILSTDWEIHPSPWVRSLAFKPATLFDMCLWPSVIREPHAALAIADVVFGPTICFSPLPSIDGVLWLAFW